MRARTQLVLLLLSFVALPLFAQVAPEATGGEAPGLIDTQMMTPPPSSGTLYPNFTGAEVRSNYLSAELAVNAAYFDNVLPGATAQPVGDTTYSILPELTLNRNTPRQQIALNYTPTIIFYEPTSTLNSFNHSASLTFQDRLSPHFAINLQNFFTRTNNWFSSAYPSAAGGITGTAQGPAPALIAPFAEEMSDTAEGAFSYQFARNGMIGAGGTYSYLDYPSSDALGLFGSRGEGASAFYSRRVSSGEYIGLSYSYDRNAIGPANPPIETQVHSFLPFYTAYFTPAFSISISGGAQHVSEDQDQPANFVQWSPAGVINMDWHGKRGDFAASYLHTIISGEGLYGAFYSDSANGAGGWKFSSTWSGRLAVSYTTTSAVTRVAGLTYNGGNGFTLGASLKRTIGERFSAEVGYDRLQEDYTGIPVLTENPDSDRGYITVTYEFRKPLGR